MRAGEATARARKMSRAYNADGGRRPRRLRQCTSGAPDGLGHALGHSGSRIRSSREKFCRFTAAPEARISVPRGRSDSSNHGLSAVAQPRSGSAPGRSCCCLAPEVPDLPPQRARRLRGEACRRSDSGHPVSVRPRAERHLIGRGCARAGTDRARVGERRVYFFKSK